MAKKSFLKVCEVKPATKVLSIRITEELHDRITAATSLASSLGYDFNLPNIFGDYLLSVIESVEKELAQVQPPEVFPPVEPPEHSANAVTHIIVEVDESGVDFCDENHEF